MISKVLKVLFLVIFSVTMLNARDVVNTPTPLGSGRNGFATAMTLPFFDNFESTDAGWTSDGFWNLIANPETIKVADNIYTNLVKLADDGYLPASYSGSYCWWYGEKDTGTFIGSDYTTTQSNLSGGKSTQANSGSLVSPSIIIPTDSYVELSFASWYEIEGVDANSFDMMYVEVSTDGTNYTELGHLNPFDDYNTGSYIAYSNKGVGVPGEWKIYTFNLSDYAGQTVNIRFRFNTKDSLYNGFRGWLIDDVSVKSLTSSEVGYAPIIKSVYPTVVYTTDYNQLVSLFCDNINNETKVYVNGVEVTSKYQGDSLQFLFSGSSYTVGQDVEVYVKNSDGKVSNTVTIKIGDSNDAVAVPSITPIEVMDNEENTFTMSGSNLDNVEYVKIGGVAAKSVSLDSAGLVAVFDACTVEPGYKTVELVSSDSSVQKLFGAILFKESGQCVFDDEEEPKPTGECCYEGMNAAPQNPMNPIYYTKENVVADPTGEVVNIANCESVYLNPSISVDSSLIGQEAYDVFFITTPTGFQLMLPPKKVVLSEDPHKMANFEAPLDFSGAAGFQFYVYYGYRTLAKQLYYNAYTVNVQECSNQTNVDCTTLDEKGCMNNSPTCLWTPFTKTCGYNCTSIKSSSSCGEAFGGGICEWKKTPFGEVCSVVTSD